MIHPIRHRSNLFLFTLVALWMTFGAQSRAAAPLTIQGGGHIAVGQDTVCLGHITKISGGTADLQRAIAAVSFGPSPQPGRSKTIDANEISRRLKGSRIDLAKIQVLVDPPIEVTRKSVTLKSEQIETAVKSFLQREMPWDRKHARIKAIRGAKNLKLPEGKTSLKVMAPRGCKYLGNEPLTVSIFSNGQFYKKVWVTATIEVRSQVVVVTKPLGRHQPISTDDIKLVDVDLSKVPSNALKRLDEAIGMRTKRKIFPKAVLRRDYVEAPHVVQRGDLVQIVARSSVLQLTAQGITKERGRLGERIRVENIDSKKQVYATVVGASTVEVQF